MITVIKLKALDESQHSPGIIIVTIARMKYNLNTYTNTNTNTNAIQIKIPSQVIIVIKLAALDASQHSPSIIVRTKVKAKPVQSKDNTTFLF